MNFIYKRLESPVGPLRVVSSEEGICGLVFEAHWSVHAARFAGAREGDDPILSLAEAQLQEYFRGTRRDFDLPLAALGTEFQKRVWDALRRIPFGETSSYRALAASLGTPQACRAVGRANGLNPISIVVPCHRVIASDGKLTGYAGGLAAKRRLLELECVSAFARGDASAIEKDPL